MKTNLGSAICDRHIPRRDPNNHSYALLLGKLSKPGERPIYLPGLQTDRQSMERALNVRQRAKP